MLPKLRSRLTYPNVMATIAVFVALGGTSYAALRVTSRNVPKDALTGADIKNLTGRDVRNNSLTGADVKNLSSGDVANGRLLAEDFAAGQLPQGPKGDKGDAGQQGPAGTAAAFAGVHGDATLFTPASLSKNVTAANISHPTMGVYCFLPFTPHSAMASGANGFNANFTLASVEINGRDGGLFSGECTQTDQARVRTVIVPSGGAYSPSALSDQAFYVWFEE